VTRARGLGDLTQPRRATRAIAPRGAASRHPAGAPEGRGARIKSGAPRADSSPVKPHSRHPSRAAGEHGIALVVALIVLLVLSLIAAALMLSLDVETKISGHDERRTQALNVAEAGVAEAIARIRSGEVPDTLNPKMATQIFLVAPGSVPVLGSDSTGLATAQPAGKWLVYSGSKRGPQVLTVTYKTDDAHTAIYRYDKTKNPAVQTVSGEPIFVVTSTGKVGAETRTVVSEVFRKPFKTNIKAALTADRQVHWIGGNAAVCGYNHSLSTPTGYGDQGRLTGNTCVPYEVGHDDLPGCWSTDLVYTGGAADEAGVPTPDVSYQTGFYAGPWEALGMTQAAFGSWLGARQDPAPTNPVGVTYLDNDGTPGNQSGSWGMGGGIGQGMLYADGDLNLGSGFVFKGLIYVEGDLSFSGHAWILGAVIVRGRVKEVKMTGGATVLYSKDAIDLMLGKYAANFTSLSWREK
jgi:type IV pilus assembly PilX-like protein